jgi:hypothetical protein
MKPSKTLIYLALAAAIIGGVGYAFIAPKATKEVAVNTSETTTSTPTTAPTATPAATATPAVSTDLKKEVEVFDTEFATVSESDFDSASLDDGSIGL